MQLYQVDGHEPSFLPDGKVWRYVWGDEFDGDTLDMSKWSFRLNFWGRRFPAYTDKGVELDGESHLKINLIEKDGQYCSAQLQTGANSFDASPPVYRTGVNACGDNYFWPLGEVEKPKFMHRYGYYEVRCKLQQQPGWWSAFWLQAPSIGTSYDPAYSGIEVDIMENFTRNGEVTSGNIYGGYGAQLTEEARVRYHVKDTPDGFHRFGLDWSEEGYIFYCDGVETARTSEPVSQVEQFILLTTECKGYRNGNMDQPSDELKGAVLPDCFTVDYVRVFDEQK